MILKDLINEANFIDVFSELTELYYDYYNDDSNIKDIESMYTRYYDIFMKLQNLEPIFKEDGEVFYLNIEEVQDYPYHDKYYWDVGGIDKNLNQKYGLDFSPWNQWLGYNIREEQLKKIDKNTYVAHCLWEMTFYGMEEETIQKTAKDLRDQVEEIENNLENTKTLKEFIDELDGENEEIESSEGKEGSLEIDEEIKIAKLKYKLNKDNEENEE